MREIKFKLWDKSNNQIVFDTAPVFRQTALNLGIKNLQDDGYVLLQYTGLKDKNGKEIYEGDVLKSTEKIKGFSGSPPKSKMPMGINKVIFKEGAFKLTTASKSTRYQLSSLSISWCGLEIIGNIYERPELLK